MMASPSQTGSSKSGSHDKTAPRTGRRRLYLMRHGHVDYFSPDITDPRMVNLTDEGRAQAHAAAQALQNVQFDFAACSGLPRTVQTATIVLAPHDRTPRLVEDLRFEELKSGWIKAKSREELAARLAYCFDDAHDENARFLPDGESFKQAGERITEGLEAHLTQGDWRTGLLVAHEGVNRLILGWATGGGLATIGAFEQDLCAINVIDFDITPREDGQGVQIERAILKLMNVTANDMVKRHLPRTCLEHLFDVDFGASRPPRVPHGAD